MIVRSSRNHISTVMVASQNEAVMINTRRALINCITLSYDMDERVHLRQIIMDTGIFKYSPDKPFTLVSGAKSPYYFDMRLLGANPRGLYLAAKIMLDMLGDDIRSVGGPETGAISIATAIALVSHMDGRPPLSTFYIRKRPKAHGTGSLMEGLPTGPAVIVDDVITTGGSALKAITALQNVGVSCTGICCVLFRGSVQDQDTIQQIAPLSYIFTGSDFTGMGRHTDSKK